MFWIGLIQEAFSHFEERGGWPLEGRGLGFLFWKQNLDQFSYTWATHKRREARVLILAQALFSPNPNAETLNI